MKNKGFRFCYQRKRGTKGNLRSLFAYRRGNQAKIMFSHPVTQVTRLLLSVLFILTMQQTVRSQCQANAGGNPTICLGQSVTIGGAPSAWGGDGNYSFDWDNANDESNPTVSPTTTTTYVLTVTDGTGCVAQDAIVVTVNPVPVVNAGPDLDPCLNDPSIALPSGGGTWSGAPGTMLSGAGVFTPNTVGTYNLVLTQTVNGCTSTDTRVVQVRSLPIVSAGIDQVICQGQTVQLSASATSVNGSIVIYTWSGGGPGNGVSNPLSQNPTASPNNTVTYNVTAVDTENCPGQDQVTVVVHPLPVVNAGLDITVCVDPTPITLTSVSAAGGTWSGTGVSSSGVMNISTPGTYTVTYNFTNSQGCARSDTRVVTVITPGVIDAGPDRSVCLNDSPITLVPVNTGGTWSGSPFVTSSGIFTPSSSGTFTLTYMLNMGTCNAFDQVQVTVHALPTTSAGADITICAGAAGTLSGAGAGTSLAWSPAAGLSATNILNPTANPLSTAVYTLQLTDANGCSSTDAVTVNVTPLPTVNAGPAVSFCQSATPVALSGQTPMGGVWSGSNVTPAGQFTPSAVGSHLLTYTYTDANGCQGSATRTVVVAAPMVVNAGPDVSACLGANPLQLQAITPSGVWTTAPLLSATGLFQPSVAGSYTFTYSVNNGVCTATDQVVVTVHALPTANAGSDVAMCAGQSVMLQGAGTGNGTLVAQWTPSLGINHPDWLQTQVAPAATSTYTLTITDGNGCVASDATVVTVNALPVVEAGVNLTVCAGAPLQLSGQSPVGGQWSGTGVSSSGSFSATAAGDYLLTYSFTSATGCVGSDARTVTVVAVPLLEAGPNQEVCENDPQLVFSDFTSSTGEWAGAGVVDVLTGAFQPSVAGPGQHAISLTLNTGVCTLQDILIVTVHAQPALTIGADVVACQGSSLVSLGTPSLTGGTWSGQGVVNAQTGMFDPNSISAGTYVVSYSFTDALTTCSSEVTKNVLVSPLPVAAFSAIAAACQNAPVALLNNSTGATAYTWNFGDGTPVQTTANPTKVYASEGTYTIQLIARNAAGCADTTTSVIHVIASPLASMSMSTTSGCAPLSVSFTNNSVAENATYEWNFGTSTFAGHTPPSQIFVEDADLTHSISLIVHNSCGTHSVSGTVHVDPRPHAQFNTDFVGTICSPATVSFLNESNGMPDSFEWNFGNGNQLQQANPSALVYTAGAVAQEYTIELVAENECGVDVEQQVITVQPNLVNASFSLSESIGCTPLHTQVENTSEGATHYSFFIPTMGITEEAEPSFDFLTAGDYTVYMYATDGCGFDTTSLTLAALTSPTVDFSTNSDLYCEESVITFEAIATNATTFFWTFGEEDDDDDEEEVEGELVQHSYENSGAYDVTLRAMAQNACEAQITKVVEIHTTPNAAFTLSNYAACSPLNTCVTNNSAGATTYQWSLSNGAAATGENPCFDMYNNLANQTDQEILLTAWNDHGCSDQFSQQVEIWALPELLFELPDFASCDTVAFTVPVNNSSSDLSFSWYVDGTFLTNMPVPTLEVAQVGEHAIQLVATTDQGCSSNLTRTFTIYPTPEASFTVDANEICLGDDVQFANTSTLNNFSYWVFGDGEVSEEMNPLHVYSEQGVYDVLLVVTSEFGCRDSVELPNIVEAFPLPVAKFDATPGETSIYLPTIQFTNASEGSDAYYWNFGDGSSSIEENPVYDYSAPGTWQVSLTVYNQFGCSDTHRDFVEITNEFQVFIPTAFTPDNDGLNDVFEPVLVGKSNIRDYDFIVMDRWGNALFSSEDPEQGWHGNVKGGDHFADAGVYNYRLIIRFEDNAEAQILTGMVTLLR
jgi:large repetitive protein